MLARALARRGRQRDADVQRHPARVVGDARDGRVGGVAAVGDVDDALVIQGRVAGELQLCPTSWALFDDEGEGVLVAGRYSELRVISDHSDS